MFLFVSKKVWKAFTTFLCIMWYCYKHRKPVARDNLKIDAVLFLDLWLVPSLSVWRANIVHWKKKEPAWGIFQHCSWDIGSQFIFSSGAVFHYCIYRQLVHLIYEKRWHLVWQSLRYYNRKNRWNKVWNTLTLFVDRGCPPRFIKIFLLSEAISTMYEFHLGLVWLRNQSLQRYLVKLVSIILSFFFRWLELLRRWPDLIIY